MCFTATNLYLVAVHGEDLICGPKKCWRKWRRPSLDWKKQTQNRTIRELEETLRVVKKRRRRRHWWAQEQQKVWKTTEDNLDDLRIFSLGEENPFHNIEPSQEHSWEMCNQLVTLVNKKDRLDLRIRKHLKKQIQVQNKVVWTDEMVIKL